MSIPTVFQIKEGPWKVKINNKHDINIHWLAVDYHMGTHELQQYTVHSYICSYNPIIESTSLRRYGLKTLQNIQYYNTLMWY